jgi:hypothetical protein
MRHITQCFEYTVWLTESYVVRFRRKHGVQGPRTDRERIMTKISKLGRALEQARASEGQMTDKVRPMLNGLGNAGYGIEDASAEVEGAMMETDMELKKLNRGLYAEDPQASKNMAAALKKLKQADRMFGKLDQLISGARADLAKV